MALLEILHHPDSRLRKKASPVGTVDETVGRLVDDMLETMYDARGIGLAATQINVHQRVIVMDLSEDSDDPLCFINAEILSKEGEVVHEEGCLSVPDYYEKVTRAEKIRVKALDKEGEPFELDAEGLLAICIQHEIDHLDGKLFVDYLSSLKQQRVRKKLEKLKKQMAEAPTKANA
uniref:Peptide deformylase n=1 Tax=uncultured Thiotrichaceae bacterium TaxID=298394 RepID=A0A6S6UK51_9GAMM|nr:MAG: Peptide deformylase (EC [uncultured Thiotrichaceae bacterium]